MGVAGGDDGDGGAGKGDGGDGEGGSSGKGEGGGCTHTVLFELMPHLSSAAVYEQRDEVPSVRVT